MKVLKEGDIGAANRKIKQTRRFECLSCGCIFECNFGEWKYVGGQYDEIPQATCPTCKQPVERVVPTRSNEGPYGDH